MLLSKILRLLFLVFCFTLPLALFCSILPHSTHVLPTFYPRQGLMFVLVYVNANQVYDVCLLSKVTRSVSRQSDGRQNQPYVLERKCYADATIRNMLPSLGRR